MDDKSQDTVNVVGNIIMPMIRKVVPTLTAGAQPMFPLSPTKTELRCGTAFLGGKKQGDWFTVLVVPPFRFMVKGLPIASELKTNHYKWMQATFGPESDDTWFERDARYYFRNESDRSLFVLRWTE